MHTHKIKKNKTKRKGGFIELFIMLTSQQYELEQLYYDLHKT